MIVELLCDLVLGFLRFCFSPLGLPVFNPQIYDVFETFLGYLGAGIVFLNNYVDFPYLNELFLCILAVEVAYFAWKVILWIIKKIPILNIK